MVLLFGGIPGGPELLVILLVLVLLLGVPLAVLLLAGAFGFSVFRSSRERDDVRNAADRGRVDELERELAETRAELERLRDQRERESDRGHEEPSGGRGDGDADRDRR